MRRIRRKKVVYCAICKKRCRGFYGLVSHLRYSHNICRKDQKKYYDKYLKTEKEGKCLYCGKETKFEGITSYYREFCKKHVRHCDKKWFIVKYGEKEGIKRYKTKFLSPVRNLRAFQKKYGKKEGLKRYTARYFNLVNTRGNHKGSWTKKWFISKYGKTEGLKRYNKRIKRISYAQSVDYYIEKYGKSKGLKIFNKIRVFARANFSKISQELFWNIYKKLPRKLKKKTYFKELNFEFNSRSNDNKFYYYDFVISNIKICIEFNGDKFHANPSVYKARSHPCPFNQKITAKQIWKYDKNKFDNLKQKGYKVLVVWSSKYEKGKEKMIKKCLEFIKKNVKK
jgi:very-short-patch-repair endonuclease